MIYLKTLYNPNNTQWQYVSYSSSIFSQSHWKWKALKHSHGKRRNLCAPVFGYSSLQNIFEKKQKLQSPSLPASLPIISKEIISELTLFCIRPFGVLTCPHLSPTASYGWAKPWFICSLPVAACYVPKASPSVREKTHTLSFKNISGSRFLSQLILYWQLNLHNILAQT